MQKMAFVMKLKKGMCEEYKKRHDNIWPEMKGLLKESGRINYSIWQFDNILFGYYETEDKSQCLNTLKNSDIFKRWNEYMSDLLLPQEEWDNQCSKEIEIVFNLD